ncbi:hypothetical protein [Deinococcus apachensis]|uniref:hypothetical protein n=1 Tax=Deinococcus apachensis TaxID=309886 RepID=UPI0012FCAA16|nr:hypothetical protein [Deinococcus apachensis]
MRGTLALIGLLLFTGCKPVAHVGERAVAVSQARDKALWAEANAYMQSLRVSLVVAATEGKSQAVTLASCNDPRILVALPLNRLKIESCKIKLKSESAYTAAVKFSQGLAFVADQNGVRQVDATQLPGLN